MRLGHVHLRVADLDRAVRFYRDLLGFGVLADQRPLLDLPVVFMTLGEGRLHLALHTFESAPPPGRTGLQHFALLYPDRPALARSMRLLRDHGYAFDAAFHNGVAATALVRDPDGHVLELYYDQPGDGWFDEHGRPALPRPLAAEELLAQLE